MNRFDAEQAVAFSQELLEADRFRQHGVAFHPAAFRFGRHRKVQPELAVGRTHDDDREVRVFLLDVIGQRKAAVRVVHDKVGDDNVELVFADQFHRLGFAFGLGDDKAFLFQLGDVVIAERPVVVDE